MKLISASLVVILFTASGLRTSALTTTNRLRGYAEAEVGSLDVAATKALRRKLPKKEKQLVLKVCNQAYQQPFGGFFVMVHNEHAQPLFECGGEASEPLALLAENGDPGPLVEHYSTVATAGVGYVGAHTEGAPFFGGDSTYIMVPDDNSYPYVTIAAMAINTNDCFVALNGVLMLPGSVLHEPGYDAGSEENNESCHSIPGPACPADSGNERSGNGEGFVHVHRGFFGIGGELSQAGYDWRNPMMCVSIYEYDEETMMPVSIYEYDEDIMEPHGGMAKCKDVVESASDSDCTAGASIDDGSYDPEEGDIMVVQVPAGPYGLGTITVTLTVTDASGELDSCTAKVTVIDVTPPTAVCKDITVQLDAFGGIEIIASQVDDGSDDACGEVGLSVSPSTFSCADLGANVVTLTVTDENGLTSICTSTVTVEDIDADGDTYCKPED